VRLLFWSVAVALALFGGWPLLRLLPEAGDWAAALGEGAALVNSLAVAGGALGLAVPVGTALGFALARAPAAAPLVLLPYVTPPYVSTIAWVTLANPTNGWLRALFPVDVYTRAGMAWVLGLHLAPVVALAVRDALRQQDPALVEAARLAGAGRARAWAAVTLPLLRPSLLAAGGVVFAASLASYGVPAMLGAPAAVPVPTLTTRVVEALDTGFHRGLPLATTLALGLMAIGVGAPLLLRALAGGLRTAGARAVRPAAPGAARGAWAGVGAFAAVAVALPWMALLVPSFTDAGRPSLVHWARVLGDARVLDAGLRSALLAGAVATAVALAGGLVAWAATRGDRLARAVGAAGRLGVAVPGSVLGLGLLVAFSQELRVIVLERVTLVVALADGAALLGIAWALRFLPLPLDLLGAAVQGVHPSLEEAARLSGAGPARAVAGVTLPLVARALGSAWLLVFVGAACEVTLSTLLAGPRAPVLGTLLFQLQTYADPRAASVLGVLASAVLVGAVALGGRR